MGNSGACQHTVVKDPAQGCRAARLLQGRARPEKQREISAHKLKDSVQPILLHGLEGGGLGSGRPAKHSIGTPQLHLTMKTEAAWKRACCPKRGLDPGLLPVLQAKLGRTMRTEEKKVVSLACHDAQLSSSAVLSCGSRYSSALTAVLADL